MWPHSFRYIFITWPLFFCLIWFLWSRTVFVCNHIVFSHLVAMTIQNCVVDVMFIATICAPRIPAPLPSQEIEEMGMNPSGNEPTPGLAIAHIVFRYHMGADV
jgi:hypothetical protein